MSMILNPYRYAAAGGGTTFGDASRSFDGNDEVTMGSAQLIDTDAAWSIALWCKLDSTVSNLYPGLLYLATQNVYPLQVFLSDTAAYQGVSFGFYLNHVNLKGGSYSDFEDTWKHIAITFDGVSKTSASSYTLYIDGVNTTTTSTGGYASTNNGTNRIGRVESGSLYFKGNIADVRVYDAELSSGDTSDLASGIDVSTNLVGWWLRNTDDVLDYAGSNDGTNNGSTYSTDGPFD